MEKIDNEFIQESEKFRMGISMQKYGEGKQCSLSCAISEMKAFGRDLKAVCDVKYLDKIVPIKVY